MNPTRTLPALLVAVPALLAGAVALAANLAPVELTAARVAPLVEELNLTGGLNAPQTSRLAPAVAGRIEQIAVDAGSRVAAGDVLVVLDDELARFELDQARAAERETEAQLTDAVRRLEEARRLARTRSFAESEVKTREAEVSRLRAVRARLEAVSAYDEALLERHRLRAPFAGVVSRRDADLGEWVGPDDPVIELVAVDRLRLDLQVPQGYFGRVNAATPLSVRIDAIPDLRLTAEVSEIVPISDPSARTFLARARLDNREGRMTPGMSVRATLRIGTGREGVVVPRDALIRYPDGRTVVWVAPGEGDTRTVEERRVETGLATAREVEIAAGLAAGENVVIRGNESLRQSQEVRVSATR